MFYNVYELNWFRGDNVCQSVSPRKINYEGKKSRIPNLMDRNKGHI